MSALTNVLWIGGAQWAGKSTVTTLLAARYPIATYRYDYHDARSHSQRARDNPDRSPTLHQFIAALDEDPSEVWVRPSPDEMADTARRIFEERFVMVLDDLAAMPDGLTVLAEGWGLRPHLVASALPSPERAVFLVPTDAFRDRQRNQVERARSLDVEGLSDATRAQRNRVARDSILAREVVADARRLGLNVIEVDGSEDETAVAARVEQQFRPFLPAWLY